MIKEYFNLVGQPCIWHISLETESSQYWVCTGKQRIVMVLALVYLQKKVMTKLFKNCKKNLFSQHFRAQFKILFWEIHISNLFSLPDFYYCIKFQKKPLMNGFSKK